MLETIRELALEKLDESSEGGEIRRRHAEHFLALAESANLSVEKLGKAPQRHDLVLPEQHNLRAAMDWAAESDPLLGLRLAVSLESFWITQPALEGARRLELLLERAEDADLSFRGRALDDLGACAFRSGDVEHAGAANEQALELFREAGDERGVAEAQFRLGVIAAATGELALARQLWEECLEEWRRLGDEVGELQALGNLGWWEFEHGDDWEHAWELTERSLELARRIGWTWWEVGRLGELAERSLEVSDVDEGERRARDFLARAREIEDRTSTFYGLGMLAWAAGERGDTERAVTLWTAIEAEEAKAPEAMWAMDRDKYAAHIPDAPRPEVSLELEQAVEYALADV